MRLGKWFRGRGMKERCPQCGRFVSHYDYDDIITDYYCEHCQELYTEEKEQTNDSKK